MDLKPIAFAKECSFKEKFGTPRQGVLNGESRAFIKLESWLPTGCLEGLENFSHLWVIWVFHQNNSQKLKGKVNPPRLGGQSIGVFASRSPHRPNPVGLSLVKLESVEAKGLWVSGVDMIEDTPILDIKPYIAEDQAVDARFGWIEENHIPKRLCHWSFDLNSLNQLSPERIPTLRSLIESTLALDPRPVVYKQLEKEQGYKGPYGLKIDEFNVRFLSSADCFEIIDVSLAENSNKA